MEHQRTRFNHESNSQIIKLLTQREFYQNQKPYTKALYSDPYVAKHFNRPMSFKAHDGCVNTVVWNDTGSLILSGSDDCRLNIWSPFDKPEKPLIHSVRSGHSSNIFSAKFMAKTNDRHIVSCSSDGIVRFTNLNDYIANSNWRPLPAFQCHENMTFEVLPDPNSPFIFFSCADDGRINKYDLREGTSCNRESCRHHTFFDLNTNHNPRRRTKNSRNKNKSNNNDDSCSQSEPETEQRSERRRYPFSFRSLEDNVNAVTAISIRPDHPVHLAAACGDDTVRIYDQRYVRTSSMPYHRDCQVYQFIPTAIRQKQSSSRKNSRMTSLKYDPNGGGDICVSYISDNVYLVRPGAGLIEKPRKERKGAVRILKKQKQGDLDSEIKKSDDNMEIDNINVTKNFVGIKIKSSLSKGETKENLVDSGKDRDTIPTSIDFGKERDIIPIPIDFGKERDTIPTSIGFGKERDIIPTSIDFGKPTPIDFGKERDTIPTSENDQVNNDKEILNEQDNQQNLWIKDEGDEEDDDDEDDDEYEDDYMYSSDEEENDIEEAYDEDVVMTYTGHLNSVTMIKEAHFFGAKSEYILSGSDDRRIFIWDKLTGKVINSLIGDDKVVNCVQPHPYYPIICTSGIDYDVKLWYPKGEENDTSDLEEILKRNEETRKENLDTNSNRVMALNINQIMQLFALFNNEETSLFNFDFE